jgi:hypothetical protein
VKRRHPNLFIVGAPRCGTTAWVKYLGEHPDVYFAERKEPHYFSEDFPGFRWARTEDDYLDFFDGVENQPVVGEASVMYLYSRVAAARLAAAYPHARILIFLRRQESFLPSYHQQLLNNRDEAITDFETVWRLSGSRTKARTPRSCRAPAFLDYKAVGGFSDQVQRYLDVFPRDQIMIMDFARWSAEPLAAYRSVLDFLNVAYDGRTDFPRVNAAKRFRFRSVASLTQSPAPWLLKVAAWVKRLPMLRDVRFSGWLRGLNETAGYQARASEALAREIDAFFDDDNRRLAALSGDPELLRRRP